MKTEEKGFGVSGGVAVEVGGRNTYGFFFFFFFARTKHVNTNVV